MLIVRVRRIPLPLVPVLATVGILRVDVDAAHLLPAALPDVHPAVGRLPLPVRAHQVQGLVLATGAIAVGEGAFIRSARDEGDWVWCACGGGRAFWLALGDGESGWEGGEEDGEGCGGEMHGWVWGVLWES